MGIFRNKFNEYREKQQKAREEAIEAYNKAESCFKAYINDIIKEVKGEKHGYKYYLKLKHIHISKDDIEAEITIMAPGFNNEDFDTVSDIQQDCLNKISEVQDKLNKKYGINNIEVIDGEIISYSNKIADVIFGIDRKGYY